MATLIEQFLEKEGYNLNVKDMLAQEAGITAEQPPAFTPPDPQTAEGNVFQSIQEQLANGQAVKFPDGQLIRMTEPSPENVQTATQEYMRQLKNDTGFGNTFTYYAVEPLLGLAERLESVGIGDFNLDEGKAQLFKDMATVASEDNPILGTTAMLGGALTSLGGGYATGGARAVSSLIGQGFGLGSRAGKIAGGTTLGAGYGALIPELERGTDRTSNVLLGSAAGAALPALPVLGRAVSAAAGGTTKAVASAATAFAPKINPNTSVGRALQTTAEFTDRIGGTLSTRIKEISEPVWNRVQKFEFDTRAKTSQWYGEVEPFIIGLQRLSDGGKNIVTRGLYNGRFDSVEEVLKKESPDLLEEFTKVRNTLESVRKQLVKAGYKGLDTGLAEYFPRLVKDYKGLIAQLGAEEQGIIQRALNDKARQLGVKVDNLDPATKTEVINNAIRGFPKSITTTRARAAQSRVIDQIDDDLLPYYATPEESLEFYLRNAAHNIEKNRFFGKGSENVAESVGAYIAKLNATGELSAKQADQLSSMLQARFIQGEIAPNQLIKFVRDMGYATTIANPLSALVQLGDLAVSAVINGLRSTIASALGKKVISIDDVKLRDRIVQEIDNPASWLDKMFKYSGFKAIDKFGKETFINAAYRKSVKMVQSEAGADAFRKKYGAMYGDEVEKMIADMRAGKVSESVKYHLFNELTGAQPITLSELPEAYLNNPNGRIFYMLKSFTLKQYDILRRNIVQADNTSDAVKFMARYAMFVSLANGTIQSVRDVLQGRITSGEEFAEEFPNQLLWESLSVLGFNQYVSERYLERGDLVGFGQALVTPAAPLFQAATKEIGDFFAENREFEIEPIARSAPIVGSAIPLMAMWYNFMFGGLESYLQEQRDK